MIPSPLSLFAVFRATKAIEISEIKAVGIFWVRVLKKTLTFRFLEFSAFKISLVLGIYN